MAGLFEEFMPQDEFYIFYCITMEGRKVPKATSRERCYLYVTRGEECHKLRGEGVEEDFSSRRRFFSTHEEANIQMLLHAANVTRFGYESIIISSIDTDVIFFLLTTNICEYIIYLKKTCLKY